MGNYHLPYTTKILPREELMRKTMYVGHLGCCNKTLFWPEDKIIPIEDKRNSLPEPLHAFMISFYGLPLKVSVSLALSKPEPDWFVRDAGPCFSFLIQPMTTPNLNTQSFTLKYF